MSNRHNSSAPVSHEGRITVEAEYTLPGCEDRTTQHWTFEGVSPHQAKGNVVCDYVPYEATLERVGLWYGSPADRPDGGHQTAILLETENSTRSPADEHHTLDKF